MNKRELLINNIRNFILVIIENGKKIESLKTSLYKNKLFDYSCLCKRIDQNKNGIISKMDLEKFLSSHSIYTPKSILNILFNYYADKVYNNEKYFSYEGFNYFLYPKNYISSRFAAVSSKNNISFELEEKVCTILMSEFSLINELARALDNFYNDNTFTIYDIITFFYNGKEQYFINDILLERFCIKYNISLTHNEMRLLLYYLKGGPENMITYNKLKNIFSTFIIDKSPLIDDFSNSFYFYTLKNFTSFFSSNQKINTVKNNCKEEIDLIHFLKEFIILENLLNATRRELYLCDDFIPIELFYIFDMKNKNGFNMLEFKNILSDYFGIEATVNEIQIIFYNYANYQKYDDSFENRNCVMKYDNFKKMIIPYDYLEKKEKIIHPELNNITNRTKNSIIKFFHTLFSVEKQIDNLRMNYFYKRDFSPYEEFIKLRNGNRRLQSISKVMLYNFLAQNLNINEKNDILNDKNIDNIFNRLDKDKDLLISYSDFCLFIEPFNSNV